MKIKFTEKTVNLGKRTYKIIIPDETDGFVSGEYIMDADRRSFQALAFSMVQLIKHKDTIIHFCLRDNAPANIMYKWERGARRCENFDVVFISHALQLNLKYWKALRYKANKTKGVLRSVDLDLEWEIEKVLRLNSKFSKTSIFHKGKDRFLYRFALDTHFFIGGVQSFAEFYLDIAKLLKTNLEENYRTSSSADWLYLPQASNSKNNYEEPMELGFWDRRFEQAHENIWQELRNRYV